MNKYSYTIFTFARINTRRFFRDRLAMFFTIIFPLIFLFVFGSIFKSSGNVSFRIALINESSSSIAAEFVKSAESAKVFKINKGANTLEIAKEKMKRSELDAAIVLPATFGQITQGSQMPTGQAVIY